jgi:hypothetical protein
MRDKSFKVREYLSQDSQNPIFELISENECETPYSYTLFLEKLGVYLALYPNQRLGQAMYMLLDAIDSDFNDYVCGQQPDPFWNDFNVPEYVILAFKRGIFKF